MVRRRGTLIAAATASVILLAGAVAWSLGAPPRASGPAAPAGQDLDPSLRTGKPTVVGFGASVCSSCREMKAVFAGIRQEVGDRYGVIEIDLLRHQEIAKRYRIQLMPTQVFFDAQGRETGRHVGKLATGEVISRLEQAASRRP